MRLVRPNEISFAKVVARETRVRIASARVIARRTFVGSVIWKLCRYRNRVRARRCSHSSCRMPRASHNDALQPAKLSPDWGCLAHRSSRCDYYAPQSAPCRYTAALGRSSRRPEWKWNAIVSGRRKMRIPQRYYLVVSLFASSFFLSLKMRKKKRTRRTITL